MFGNDGLPASHYSIDQFKSRDTMTSSQVFRMGLTREPTHTHTHKLKHTHTYTHTHTHTYTHTLQHKQVVDE